MRAISTDISYFDIALSIFYMKTMMQYMSIVHAFTRACVGIALRYIPRQAKVRTISIQKYYKMLTFKLR